MLYADWVPTIPGEAELSGIKPTAYPDNEQLLQHILGPLYKPRIAIASKASWQYVRKLLHELPPTLKADWEYYGNEVLSTAMKKDGITALISGMVTRLAHHGAFVVSARNHLLRELGYRPDPVTMVPIQPHIHPRIDQYGKTQFLVDDIGNIGISMFVDGAGIGKDVSASRTNQTMLNFSFQPGQLDVFCIAKKIDSKGNVINIAPEMSYIGPYQYDRAETSLLSLIDMSNIVGNMHIVSALGNNDDRPAAAQKALIATRDWTVKHDTDITLVNEAMLIGKNDEGDPLYQQWHGTQNIPNGVSVNTAAFRYGWGSSIAASVISATGDIRSYRGLSGSFRELLPEVTGAEGEPLRVVGDMDSVRLLVN